MGSETTATCERHCVISLGGEIDMAGAPAMRDALMAVINDASDRTVILDLETVSFMDSSGVGALLSTYRDLKAVQRVLVIANAQPIVARVLELTNVDSIIPMFHSVDDAAFGCPLTHVVHPVRRFDTAV